MTHKNAARKAPLPSVAKKTSNSSARLDATVPAKLGDLTLPVLSLFSGAGGLDIAFESTGGFRTVLAIEHQAEFCETLEAAVAHGFLGIGKILQTDIRTVDPLEVVGASLDPHIPLAGIIGGPPCEAFSSMGLKKGLGDSRGLLVYEYLRFVEALRPAFFLIENVRAFGTMHEGKVLQDIQSRMSSIGYAVTHKVLCAADYGAATIRKRLFIVGCRGNMEFIFPAPTHTRTSASGPPLGPTWVPSSAVLGDLPPASEVPPGNPVGHVSINHTREVQQRFADTPPGGYDYVRKRSRLHWDRPSPSLVAGDLRQTRSLIHPLEPRELTNCECARIQGFPDGFPFHGNKNKVAKQIANSVPIPLAVAIAESLLHCIVDSQNCLGSGFIVK